MSMPSPQPPSGATAAAGALATAADAVGDRWSLLVVSRLLAGPRRFRELLAELDGRAPHTPAPRPAAPGPRPGGGPRPGRPPGGPGGAPAGTRPGEGQPDHARACLR